MIAVLTSCDQNKDLKNGDDCYRIDCVTGDFLKLEFISNGENVLVANPSVEILITQRTDTLPFQTNTIINSITVFLETADDFSITLDNQKLDFSIESVFLESECCGSRVQVDKLTLNDDLICIGATCDELITINLNQ